MVDKLFLPGELFALRCSFKNLPMLCPIFIRSLFYKVFYTKDGLDFPLAHGYRSVRPTRLGPSGLVFCFYPLQKEMYLLLSLLRTKYIIGIMLLGKNVEYLII